MSTSYLPRSPGCGNPPQGEPTPRGSSPSPCYPVLALSTTSGIGKKSDRCLSETIKPSTRIKQCFVLRVLMDVTSSSPSSFLMMASTSAALYYFPPKLMLVSASTENVLSFIAVRRVRTTPSGIVSDMRGGNSLSWSGSVFKP